MRIPRQGRPRAALVCAALTSVLTAAMMLEHCGFADAAQAVENAVIACVSEGKTTRDAGGNLGTREVGDAILSKL